MGLKFFLDAEGGSLAFLKEQDFADYDNAVYRLVSAVDTVPFPAPGDPETLDVKDVRNALISFVPTNVLDSYSFFVWGYTGSQNANMQAWTRLDGGLYQDEQFALTIGVDVFGIEWLYVQIVQIINPIHTEMARIPYEAQE